MDKKMLKNILGYVAAGLGLIAFIMIFLKAVSRTEMGIEMSVKGSEIAFGHKEGGVKVLSFNFLALLAYLLPLAGGVVALVAGFKKNDMLNWVAAGLFIVGAILLFLMPSIWYLFPAEKEAKKFLKAYELKLAVGAILAAIFAILGAAASIARNFIKESN